MLTLEDQLLAKYKEEKSRVPTELKGILDRIVKLNSDKTWITDFFGAYELLKYQEDVLRTSSKKMFMTTKEAVTTTTPTKSEKLAIFKAQGYSFSAISGLNDLPIKVSDSVQGLHNFLKVRKHV